MNEHVTITLEAKDFNTALKHLHYASISYFKTIEYFEYREDKHELIIKGIEL